MNRAVRFRFVFMLVALLLTAIFLLAQQGLPARRALVINGHSVPDAVVQINGHSYVEIAVLAEATHATVKFLPDRVVLTTAEETVQPPPSPPQSVVPHMKEGISREFARAALAELALMREWQDAVIGMIKAGEPVSNKLKGFHERAVEGLRLASVAAISTSDQNALQLLRNGFATIQQWSAAALVANKAMSGEQAVNPEFPENDAMIAKMADCQSFLNSMIVSGTFADSPSCH